MIIHYKTGAYRVIHEYDDHYYVEELRRRMIQKGPDVVPDTTSFGLLLTMLDRICDEQGIPPATITATVRDDLQFGYRIESTLVFVYGGEGRHTEMELYNLQLHRTGIKELVERLQVKADDYIEIATPMHIELDYEVPVNRNQCGTQYQAFFEDLGWFNFTVDNDGLVHIGVIKVM